jgi:ABC-type transport system involved in cytochrome bd biosynthesis fused ATPase/permease subunit
MLEAEALSSPASPGRGAAAHPEKERPTKFDAFAKLVQTLAVIVGVVMSVLSFNSARKAEAAVRELELTKRQAEAAHSFVELRQKLYLEAVQTIAKLSNPNDQSEEELEKAKKRFRELYVAELSLVEGVGVEAGMKALAEQIDPGLCQLTPAQLAAYHLAHGLRDSLRTSWGFNADLIDNPHP